MLVTDFGITSDVMPELAKAPSPMLVTDSGIVRDDKSSQS